MGTKKGQKRKTARRAYEPKKTPSGLTKKQKAKADAQIKKRFESMTFDFDAIARTAGITKKRRKK